MQTDCFAEDYNIVVPFTRGLPPSEAPQQVDRYNPDATTLDLIKILEPYHDNSLFIVGHDLGCVYASRLAETLGRKVTGLVLINGMDIRTFAKRLRNPTQALRSWYMYLMQVPLLPDFAAKHLEHKLQMLAYKKGGLPPEKQPDAHELTGAVTGPLNQYRAFFRRTWDELTRPHKKIKCPVLILFGDQDAFLTPPTTDEFMEFADDVAIRILHGNHWIHREQPETINDILTQFFADNREPDHA